MINATALKETTVQSTAEMFNQTSPLIPQVTERYFDLLIAPFHFPDMVWIIIPMLATLLLMEFYFGRYQTEELGWNTAVGNAVVLIFVSIDLFRQIYGGDLQNVLEINPMAQIPLTTMIAFVVGILGLALLFFDFFHLLPKKLAFMVSSSLPINLIAYLSIILVYTNLPGAEILTKPIPLDMVTILATILLFISLIIFFAVIHFLEPKSRETMQMMLAKDQERKARRMVRNNQNNNL